MASISLVVKVTITKGTRTVSLQAFNIPVILGPSDRFVDPFKVYINAADMLDDGFLSSDPEYIHAVELTEQAIVPDEFIVSKFTDAVAQVDTFAVNTVTASHAYSFKLNGTTISYTQSGGDVQQDILAGLLTAIGVAFPSNPPVTGSVTGTGGSALLHLTSSVAGIGISYTNIDALLTHASVTANHSVVADLQTLQTFTTAFYGVLFTTKDSNDIKQIAAYIESQLLIYVASSSEAGILTSSSTDLATALKNLGYTRTALLYSAAPAAAPDAAWMGYMLPTTPGSSNWKFKVLVGIDPDNLNETQIFNAQSKNANVYVPLGGAGATLEGIMVGGEFIDVTIFIDWLQATVQANVFAILVDPNNLKVPYTNKGIVAIENGVQQSLQQGENNGGLATGWTVQVPDVSAVPRADKASRTLNNVTFQAQLAGAINKVNIHGFVSV